MHNMSVFTPILKDDLTLEERKKAISSLMFLKEKRDKTVKGRFCADGRKQRGDWTKQETTSPTVSTESVFLSAELPEHRPLLGLIVYIGPHLFGGAVLHYDLALIDLVLHIKILNLDMFGSLRAAGLPVGLG